VFLSVFEWSYRKGWDVMLAAWAAAFGPDDDVSLVLRTSPVMDRKGPVSPASTNSCARSAARDRMSRQLWSLTSHFPRRGAAALCHRRRVCQCVEGEGWGRPMMEAMACRLPTIGTRWSGNLEFMNDDNSLLIDIEGLRPVSDQHELFFYRGRTGRSRPFPTWPTFWAGWPRIRSFATR